MLEDRPTTLVSLAKHGAYAVVAAIVICLGWQSALTLFASREVADQHAEKMRDLDRNAAQAIERIQSQRAQQASDRAGSAN